MGHAHISRVMCLPGESDPACITTEDMHLPCPSEGVVCYLKGGVTPAYDKHRLVLVDEVDEVIVSSLDTYYSEELWIAVYAQASAEFEISLQAYERLEHGSTVRRSLDS